MKMDRTKFIIYSKITISIIITQLFKKRKINLALINQMILIYRDHRIIKIPHSNFLKIFLKFLQQKSVIIDIFIIPNIILINIQIRINNPTNLKIPCNKSILINQNMMKISNITVKNSKLIIFWLMKMMKTQKLYFKKNSILFIIIKHIKKCNLKIVWLRN